MQIVQKTGDSPGAVLGSVGTRPSLYNDRLDGADSAETVEVPQVQYSDWVVDVPAVAVHRQVTELMGFLEHFAPFSRSSGLSRSRAPVSAVGELSMMKSSSSSRARGWR